GWEYEPGQIKQPGYMGRFINKYVYGKPFPPGVLEKLKDQAPKNERGNRSSKLWQWLSIHTGNPQLDKVLASDIAIMQLSADMDEFERNFDRVYGLQLYLNMPKPKDLPPAPDQKLLP
ncbi:MAG: P63C domain-containing protein, partial [Acidobacteriota bacterium]|nr:P63C domain-containing protein [Acidobacteriota bacterium]